MYSWSYRTKYCWNGSRCPRRDAGTCRFAHDDTEIRCLAYAETGECANGDYCSRHHSPPVKGSNKKRKSTYRGHRTAFASHGMKPKRQGVFYQRNMAREALELRAPAEIAKALEQAEHRGWLDVRGLTPALDDLRAEANDRELRPAQRQAASDELFKWLLWLEHAQGQHDIRFYERFGQTITPSGYGLYRVDCPGLAEKRPSVLRGDAVDVQDEESQEWHRGYVHFVNMDHLVISLASRGVDLDSTFTVVFTLPETPIRRQINALLDNGRMQILDGSSLRSVAYRPRDDRPTPKEAESMNPEQLRFVQRVDWARPTLSILHGPPGTGKTYTVCRLILNILACDKFARVLVMTPSNESCDLIVQRIRQLDRSLATKSQMLRVIGASRDPKSVPGDVQPHLPQAKEYPTEEEVQQARVVACTLMTSHVVAGVLRPNTATFTHFVVDEAGQCTYGEIAVGLRLVRECTAALRARTGDNHERVSVVLAGDHKQLGPVVRNATAASFGLATSPMERLAANAVEEHDQDSVVMLQRTYRFGPTLLGLINPTYNGLLKSTRQDAKPAGGFGPLTFRHMVGAETRESQPSWINLDEAGFIVDTIVYLIRYYHVDPTAILVISPYAMQVKKIQQKLHFEVNDEAKGRLVGLYPSDPRNGKVEQPVRVGSVELFQGREADWVFVSCVRSQQMDEVANDKKFTIGFLSNPKRTNVALSRAREHLVIVGNAELLSSCDPEWKRVVNYSAERNALYDRHGNRIKTETLHVWAQRAAQRAAPACSQPAPQNHDAARLTEAAWQRPE